MQFIIQLLMIQEASNIHQEAEEIRTLDHRELIDTKELQEERI